MEESFGGNGNAHNGMGNADSEEAPTHQQMWQQGNGNGNGNAVPQQPTRMSAWESILGQQQAAPSGAPPAHAVVPPTVRYVDPPVEGMGAHTAPQQQPLVAPNAPPPGAPVATQAVSALKVIPWWIWLMGGAAAIYWGRRYMTKDNERD